jgi:hypothetical protein
VRRAFMLDIVEKPRASTARQWCWSMTSIPVVPPRGPASNLAGERQEVTCCAGRGMRGRHG